MKKDNYQRFDEMLDGYIHHNVDSQEEEQLMKMLDVIADKCMPDGMEQRLEKLIDGLADEDAPVAVVAPKTSDGFALTSYFRKYAAAACAVLVIGIGVAVGHMAGGADPFSDTCSTPVEAEAQMMRALTMLSTHSQKGMNEARRHIEAPRQQTDYSRYFSFE